MKKILLLLLIQGLLPCLLFAQINLDSLFGVWNDPSRADTLRLEAVGTIVQRGFLFSQPDSAYQLAQSMYDYAEQTGHESWRDAASNYQGISLAIRGNHNAAIEKFSNCLEISERLGNEVRIAGCLNNIGLLYKEIGDPEHSMEYLNRAIDIYERIDDTRGIALTLGNIAAILDNEGNHKEALEHAERSSDLFKQIGDEKGYANGLSSIGTAYASMADVNLLEGDIEAGKANQEKSMEYLNRSMGLREKAGDKDGMAVTLHAIGLIRKKQGKTEEAIGDINRSLELAQEVGSATGIRSASEELAALYEEAAKPAEALEMLKLYNQVNDEILSEENQRAVISEEYRYEYKKQKELDAIENEKRLAIEKEKKEKQRILTVGIAVGLILALALALVFFNRLKVTRRQKKEIEIQKKRAERSEKFKERFLANMSHEIRTPMHAVSGMAKILKRKKHLPEQNVYLDAIRNNSEHLHKILNDILDLSKIEAGKIKVERLVMSPKKVVENAIQVLAYKAQEKGLALSATFSDALPELMLGDPTRLSQILLNLAGNAIKFSDKGKVEIHARKKGDEVVFEVRDQGIGIEPDQVDRIFGAFEQASDSTTRTHGGTGLGLNISKQLVELQGGRIWADSEPGKGSTFHVTIPFEAPTEGSETQGNLPQDQIDTMAQAMKGLRILLAEDNPFNQMIAKDDLTFFIPEVQLDVVENGALAFEKRKTSDYDLILMDVQMPKMNGHDATRNIRSWEEDNQAKAIPIIAMTASLLKSEIGQCYDSGMNSYIPKPYKTEELIGRMFEMVEGGGN